MISYEEIGGNKDGPQVPTVDVNQVTQAAYAKSRAAIVAEKFLKLKLRFVVRLWRKETESYLSEIKFRLRNTRLQMQKQKVIKLIQIKVANEKAVLRHAFQAFSRWHLET